VPGTGDALLFRRLRGRKLCHTRVEADASPYATAVQHESPVYVIIQRLKARYCSSLKTIPQLPSCVFKVYATKPSSAREIVVCLNIERTSHTLTMKSLVYIPCGDECSSDDVMPTNKLQTHLPLYHV